MIDIKKINSLDKSEFLSIFGNVFEKSKWISEKVFDKKPFKNLDSFVSEIIAMYENTKTPNCFPTNNPKTIPRGTLSNKEESESPSRDTPALANANKGIIPKAT